MIAKSQDSIAVSGLKYFISVPVQRDCLSERRTKLLGCIMTWRLLRLTSMRLFVSLFVHHFKWESNAEPVRKLNNREPDLHVIIDISVVKESNHTQSLHHWELITVSAALVADMRQRRSYWCGADPARDGGGREICDNRSDEIGCQTSACDYSLSYEKPYWYTLFSVTWYHWFQSYVIYPHCGLYI